MIVQKNIVHRINCYILILATILYYSQGVLFSSLSIIGSLSLIMIYLLSLFYLLKMFFTKNNIFVGLPKLWLIFFIFNFAYFIFTGNYERDKDIFKMVSLNLLPFYMTFYLAQKKILNRDILIIFFLIALALFIVKFRLSLIDLQNLKNRDEVVNNFIYLFIGLLPFVLLLKRRILAGLSLIVIWYFIVLSSKRTAVFVGLLAFMIYIYQTIKLSKQKYKFLVYLIAILLVIAFIKIVDDTFSRNEFLISRVELMFKGDAAGRGGLIQNQFLEWYNSNNLITYIFGLGYNSSQKIQDSAAHNDWMDMLGSFGLVGFVIYAILWFYLIRELLAGNWDIGKKSIMILCIIISLTASFFFRWYNSPFPYLNFLILPYLVATKEEEL